MDAHTVLAVESGTAMSIIDVTQENTSRLLSQYDCWMFDCDGVLWNGDQMVPGANEFINLLLRRQKKVFFISNNSTRCRKQYIEKFASFGMNVTVVCEVIGRVIHSFFVV